jgi:hypothetical protein
MFQFILQRRRDLDTHEYSPVLFDHQNFSIVLFQARARRLNLDC